MSFVHLHNHSEYSLLRGAIRIPDLITKTKDLGMPAVALTDYGNLFGAVDFFLEAQKQGVQPLIGCVVFHPSNDDHTSRVHRRGMDHLFELLLLIQNQKGYENLCKLVTRSYLDGFYYKPRIDSQLLSEYSEGLIALSSGWDGALNHYLFNGNGEKAKQYLETYQKIFPDRFYVELQENGIEGQHDQNLKLIDLAQQAGVGVVATNNCHYLVQDDAEAFETLMCIQTGRTLHGTNDQLRYSTDGYYFKSPDEMKAQFDYCPEAISATVDIAKQCGFEFDLKNYYFPRFDPPENKTLDEFLADEAYKGLDERWEEIAGSLDEGVAQKDYQERLDVELGVIKKMGFAGYFLIVSDFILYAKKQGIPVGPGRGSAAGSLVAYCIRITDVDPLPYNLLFERFLNPERISMPDVDIDFCMNRRDEVLEYVGQKYGNVSQIITFGKMKAKAVIRDVGRVMEMPYDDVDKIAKLVPNALNITLDEAIKQEPRLKELIKKDPQVNRLIQIALRLEGLNRHASTHAAGVVISDKSLDSFLPLYKGGNGDVVTQFDMKFVEKIGLIKFDFLGLKTLTVIQDALEVIKQTRNIDIEILKIAMDDDKVYELLSNGDTGGVFQLESTGMKDLMVRMKPSSFEDLIALVALYRPGPLGSGMVDDFINRKHGKTAIVYDLDQLAPILEETYGVIVYQEQVMRIAAVLAGYSLGEADILRRAMGKKKPEEMAAQKIRFMEGAEEKKIPKGKAEKIFDLMAKFAEYGFNKSHSAAYALVSYQTAYLKAHYPVEYLAALLTTEMQNTDRILYYIQDAKARGIEVLPPDVNESQYGFSVVGETQIRFGLGAVKNVGQNAIESIIEVRAESSKGFTSFFDFCDRADHRKINRRVVESLIKCGAFDRIEKRRASLFEVIDTAVDLAQKKQKDQGLGQASLFSVMGEDNEGPIGISLPDVEDWSENEKLTFEKEALGFYISGHPLKVFENQIDQICTTNSFASQKLGSEIESILAGIITQSKVITTKKGSRMAFVNFEDLKGSLEVIVFADVFKKYSAILEADQPIVIKGMTDRTEDGVKIIASQLWLLKDYMGQKIKSIHFHVPQKLFTEDRMQAFRHILSSYHGNCKGYLHLVEQGVSETVFELTSGLNPDDQEMITSKMDRLFEHKVVEYCL